MNYSKNPFTVPDFMAIPIHRPARSAPIGVPFFSLDTHIQQRIALEIMAEQQGMEAVMNTIYVGKIRFKFDYWLRVKDGNVVSRGGYLVGQPTALAYETPDVGTIVIKND